MTQIKESQYSRGKTTPAVQNALLTQILRMKKTTNQNQQFIKQTMKILNSLCSQLSHFHQQLAEEKEGKCKNQTFLQNKYLNFNDLKYQQYEREISTINAGKLDILQQEEIKNHALEKANTIIEEAVSSFHKSHEIEIEIKDNTIRNLQKHINQLNKDCIEKHKIISNQRNIKNYSMPTKQSSTQTSSSDQNSLEETIKGTWHQDVSTQTSSYRELCKANIRQMFGLTESVEIETEEAVQEENDDQFNQKEFNRMFEE